MKEVTELAQQIISHKDDAVLLAEILGKYLNGK